MGTLTRMMSINFVQKHSDSIRGLERDQLAMMAYSEGYEDAKTAYTIGQQGHGILKWHDNIPDAYCYFVDRSVFIVLTEILDETTGEVETNYDMVYADCSDSEMELRYAYTDEACAFHWNDVTRFCLISGHMPTKELEEQIPNVVTKH